MTGTPQFETEELRAIADALSSHVDKLRLLYPKARPGSPEYERLGRLLDLRSKALGLIIARELP